MEQLSLFKDIEEFHKKFDLPALKQPGFLASDITSFRVNFMQEELEEFITAYNKRNLEAAFDALIDLTYVVLGTAYQMGLPFNDGWRLVHEANMKKIKAKHVNESKRNNINDVVKPENWIAPNLSTLLNND